MHRRISGSVAVAVVALALAGCGGGNDGDGGAAPTSSLGPPASTSAAPQGPATEPPEPSATQTSAPPTLGPTIDAGNLAAFQLCGTALGLAAGFIGQVPAEQLAEGAAAVADARADYVDDGSGLLDAVDAVVAAIEDDDQAAVIAAAQTLGEACKSFDPGT